MTIIDASPETGPRVTRLEDYSCPAFHIHQIKLRFLLKDEDVDVHSILTIQRRNAGSEPLVLAGHDVQLISVHLDGRALAQGDYVLGAEELTIPAVPQQFTLEIHTRVRPQANTSLMGLYKSEGNFCTQCEAEGFRKITYYLDRPDVLAVFTTTLEAEKSRYPYLLSNGNLIDSGDLSDGRHFATWHDPFPKPSYLFALIAGNLARIEDHFYTRSGRRVALQFFVEHHNANKCAHAMESLKRAMRWDEDVYGREYDLDVYMVVAVDDFNMGAMENKGLNIFNSKYVLANPDTATDADFQAIESIIGHEYFHNWSGNRITCRDWFQLSLKEGFTVFRDQEFSADMHSRGVKRIADANYLRTYQFREDAGPTAHPVRPASYIEINNFYTSTVYQKGAEVVRMLHTLLGAETFRRGTDLYFSRFDGQAVTTDDFVAVMEEVSATSLTQFKRWYSQAGTPELKARGHYDPSMRRYTLHVTQHTPPTPGQPRKDPVHIPVRLALLNQDGCELPLKLVGESAALASESVLSVTQAEQQFVFTELDERPTLSILRGFSAPVKLDTNLADADFYFLMAHDSDPFNRWEAGQRIVIKLLLGLVQAWQQGETQTVDPALMEAFRRTLVDDKLDPALAAQLLSLPSEAYVGEFLDVIDPDAIHAACRHLREHIARGLTDLLWAATNRCQDDGPYKTDALSVGRRQLKNLCLSYLMELREPSVTAHCMAQFERAANMTDVMAALTVLANTECAERALALQAFHDRWHHDAIVMDKWLAVQATSRLPGALEEVKALAAHPVFNLKNPNRVRALIGAFCNANAVNFHRGDGAGYAFLADHVIALDPINPQVAARLSHAFGLWRRYDTRRQVMMRSELERIAAVPGLSRDVYEIVSSTLKAGAGG